MDEIVIKKGTQKTYQFSAFKRDIDENNRTVQEPFMLFENDYVLADICIQNSAVPADRILRSNIPITEADGYQVLFTVTTAESTAMTVGNSYEGQFNVKKAGGLEPTWVTDFKVIVKPTII